MVFVHFHNFNVFEKITKKVRFWIAVWEPKLRKIDKNGVEKHLFFISKLQRFFIGFLRFWFDFGKPWTFQKLQKIRKN